MNQTYRAIGGHFELALLCDLIIAAENASFRVIESQTGMIPLAGGLQRLSERIGRGRTAKLYLLSVPVSGTRAGEIGLATCVVREVEVDPVATELAEGLAAGPTLAFGAALALPKTWSSGGVAGADDVQLDPSMRLFHTNDAQQAFAALKKSWEAGEDKSESEADQQIAFTGT